MEEFLDRYTNKVLAGDEKGAEEVLLLFPGAPEELKELMGLVKELSLIYRPVRPSLKFKGQLFKLLKASFRPSSLRAFLQWTRKHKYEIAIGTAIAGSACSLLGAIAYFVKVKKAAA